MIDHPELFVLRHGETAWNRQGKFQGRKDLPLTEIGEAHAQAQRKILSGLQYVPSVVRVSPLGRALQTARIALPLDADLVVDDRLAEIDFGDWEGATRDQIRSEIDYPFEDGTWNFRSPNGETFEMISDRVSSFLSELTEPMVIVTHGTTSIVLRGLCMGLDQAGMLMLPKDQGCVYRLSQGKEKVLRQLVK